MSEHEALHRLMENMESTLLESPAYMICVTDEEEWAINGHRCHVHIARGGRRGYVTIYRHTNSTDTYETASNVLCAAAREWLDKREPNWRSMRGRDLHS